MYNYEQEICDHIERNYPTYIKKTATLPKAYVGNDSIRVIILGADPTFPTKICEYDHVLDLNNSDSPFKKGIELNLNELGLNLQNVYVQNLVRNFFNIETIMNPVWKDCAPLWMDLLKRELDHEFDRNIPILATSWKTIQVITGTTISDNLTGQSIYNDNRIINENENFFGRKLIAFFHNKIYNLSNWPDYKSAIKKILPKSVY